MFLSKARHLFSRLSHYLCLFESGLAVVLLFLVLLFAVIQILLRNLFDSGIANSGMLIQIMVFWLAMLGASIATRQRKQIVIDIVLRLLPKQYQRYVQSVALFATSVICFFIAFHAGRFVEFERLFPVEAFWVFNTWHLQVILPLTLGIIAVRYLFYSVQSFLPEGEEG